MPTLQATIVIGLMLSGLLASAHGQVNGHVYREQSHAEVYVVEGGRKIWVPTQDSLFALGHGWDQVEVVPNGFLQNLPRFDIPSNSATPGSLWYPPTSQDGGPNHFALGADPRSVVLRSGSREIRLTFLQGWIRRVGDPDEPCGDGNDFHYFLEVDVEWAEQQGIDLQSLLRVGNIAKGIHREGSRSRAAYSVPIIEAELDAAGRMDRHPPGNGKPADWNFARQCDGETRIFPFDPVKPDGQQQLPPPSVSLEKRGPYVRIYGSLVTDSPHDVQTRPNVILSRWLGIRTGDEAEWAGSVPDWSPGLDSSNANHFARWTEIHPPDKIEVLPDKEPKYTTLGVAIAARTSALPGDAARGVSCENVDFDLSPDTPRPSGQRIAWKEMRGPETHWPWGEDADNGSWIFDGEDKIHVRAKVCGGALFTSPGRFKALYSVWWVPAAAPPRPPTECELACMSDRDSCMAAVPGAGNAPPGTCVLVFNHCMSACGGH